MIKDHMNITRYEVQPWTTDVAVDEKCKTWIWNELMGETAKGDTLEFVILTKALGADDTERLYCGIQRDETGAMKALIPAMHETFVDGVLDMVECDGRTRHDDMDGIEPESCLVLGQIDVDMDEIGRQFLKRRGSLVKTEEVS